MKKKVSILIIFLSFSFVNSFSQSTGDIIANFESDLLLTNNKIEKVRIHIKLANIYIDVSLSKSFKHLSEIDKILRRTTIDNYLKAEFYEAYGDAYYAKINFSNALEYYKKELVIIKSLGYNAKADSITYNIAATAYQINDLKTSEKYYKELLISARNKNDIELIKKLNLTLYKINSKRKNYREALLYLEAYLNLIDSDFLRKATQITILKKQVNYTSVKLNQTTKNLNITNTKLKNTSKNLTETNITLEKTNRNLDSVTKEKLALEVDTLRQALSINQLEFEKSKKEQEIQQKVAENKLQAQEISSRKKVISLLTAIIGLVFIGTIFIFLLYRKIKRQNNVLTVQKQLIEEKNTEITQSINYASRIQNSIMLTEATIRTYLPDLFIYFQPRDIVSGDFYWFTQIESKILIAAVDCTGHGVPGAFLSMIGNTLLNKIVNEYRITSPSLILTYLHEGMMATLEQNANDQITEDGMDMNLCSIIPDEKLVLYSGAKNPLLVFIENQLVSIKGDFQSIGEHPLRPGMDVEFTEHQIAYDDETIIYLMSDGYTDQFGGDGKKSSKFNASRFKKMLLENSNKPMQEIKKVISDSMDNWKKDNEQTDDILVIGIRLKDITINE